MFDASLLSFAVINEDAVYDLLADDNAGPGIVGTAAGDCPVPLPDNTPITHASNKYFTVTKSQNAQGLPVYTIGLTPPAR